MKKKIIALLLAVCMLASAMPFGVLAEDPEVMANAVDAVVGETSADCSLDDLDLPGDMEEASELGDVDLSDSDQGENPEGEGQDASGPEADPLPPEEPATGAQNDAAPDDGGESDGDSQDETNTPKISGLANTMNTDAGFAPDENRPADALTGGVDAPDGENADENTDQPADETEDEPVDDTEGEPTDDTEDEPADDTEGEPADDTVDEPVDDTVGEPAVDAGDEPAEDGEGEAVTGENETPAGEDVGETTEETAGETTGETVEETKGEPEPETDVEPLEESVDAPAEETSVTLEEDPIDAAEETADDSSVELTEETPVEAPVEQSDEATDETLDEQPGETSDEALDEQPGETTDDGSVEQPVESPIEATVEQPAEQPVEQPAEQPVKQTTEAPAQEPTPASAVEQTAEPEAAEPVSEVEVKAAPEADEEVVEVSEEQYEALQEIALDEATEAQEASDTPLTLDQTSATLLLNETCAIVAAGGKGVVTWTTDNVGVASVDAQGVVTAISVGSAKIVATDESGAQAACDVTVLEYPEDVAFEGGQLLLGLKEKRAPRLVWDGGRKVYKGEVTYSTDNARKVKVTADNRLKALRKGSAIITATLGNGRTVSCRAVVKKAPKKIKIKPAQRSIGVGETLTLKYSFPSGGAGGVTWTSTDPSVAVVDPDTGLITALAPGATFIKARTYNKKVATATISVFAAPASVAFESKVIAVGLGETIPLKAFVNEGAFSNLSFAVANPGVAAIDGDSVTGLALGETAVVVTTYNNLQDTATIVVKPGPSSITLPYSTLRMGKGERLQLTPDLGGGASQLTYSSNRKKIVKVTSDGVLKALKLGTAYITIKSFNNVKLRLKVVVKKAPSWVSVSPNPLKLGVGETFTLKYKLPSGTAGSATFTGDAPTVFSVNETTGEITGLSTGTGNVTVTTYNGNSITCPVTVMEAPTSVAFDPSQLSIAKNQEMQLQMVFSEGGWSNITYEVVDRDIATIDEYGVITGIRVGQTVIRAYTYVPGLYAEATFTVWGSPSKVWFDEETKGLNVGESFQLEPKIAVGCKTTFTFESSDETVATVSADGVVKALKRGVTILTVTTHNDKKASMELSVYDPEVPSAIALKSEEIPVLSVGGTWQPEYVVTPEGVDPQLVWTSSNTDVATVDENGLITAVSYGYTTIKAVPANNPEIFIKFKLTVQSDELSLVIPARTTDIEGIPANLALIDDIEDSALREINRLQNAGELSSESASKRKSMIKNIFKNYAFPWMTTSKQSYWKAANSENGAKDFKTGVVYYGMPYISGSGANRHYDVDLALKEGRYTDSGQGYYLLNKEKHLNGKYVGNDCSGLVNVSIWGTSSSHTDDRTDDIAQSDAYRTIGSYEKMLPGDLICKANAHVVMFLYYASADKSKIMIIENGGSEKGTNTVHCDVHNASSYKKSGYSVRRLASL